MGLRTLRDVSVKLGEWAKHLVNYHDGRFADDPRLRYVLLNMIQRRQQSIMRAFPDALDLMLICVESGMSIESAFTKVAAEIGTQSAELAEELALTTAELSYLPDRRQARS